MGMDLSGVGGHFRFGCDGWERILDLAHSYGWEPTGTDAPHWRCEEGRCVCENWGGTYFSNSGQSVTDDDAKGIAKALERALDDLPDDDVITGVKDCKLADLLPPERAAELPADFREIRVLRPDEHVSHIEGFSGEEKQHVRDFIAYCQAGGFHIM